MKITDHINFALDARVSSDKQDDISNQAQHENTETGATQSEPQGVDSLPICGCSHRAKSTSATLGPGLQAVEAAQQRQPQ
jgi:hypothetical protein